MRKLFIKALGGYTKGEVLTEAVKHCFNTINEEDILKEENGIWYFQGKEMNKEFAKQLIEEARLFTSMRLWKVLQADIKWQANRKMFEKAVSVEDMIMGKSWTYVLDVIKTRLKSITRESGNFSR